MNIGVVGPQYSDFQLCTIVDGLQDLGHVVWDLSGSGRNYMERLEQFPLEKIDFFITADTNNMGDIKARTTQPKVIIHGHDRWTDYQSVPNSPVKIIHHRPWVCDIAFIRDLDRGQFSEITFPIYPMEFSIERRFMEESKKYSTALHNRQYDIAFFGTRSTANRDSVLKELEKRFNCNFGDQWTFMDPDDKWSKWVNGRYVHAPRYYETLSKATFALSPLGAGPSCGRTYEAYAMACIPLIQKYPDEIEQIVPFIDEENCLLWSNIDELVNKIEKYLSNTGALHDLYQACYSFGQKNLLSKHRAQFILDKMWAHNLIGGEQF